MRLTAAIDGTRETTWLAVALVLLADIAAIVFVVIVSFHNQVGQALEELHHATGGLLDPMLPRTLFQLAVAAFVIFAIGRLRPSDVGWRAPAILPGLLVGLGFWVAMQVVLAVIVILKGGEFAWREVGFMVGYAMAQFLGVCLHEETLCRGFLLPQLYLKAAKSIRKGLALAIAVLVSQVYFALWHMPAWLLLDHPSSGQILQWLPNIFIFGVVFAVTYLVTGNLFIAMAVHAFHAERTTLVEAPKMLADQVWFWLTVALLVGWLVATRIKRGSLPAEDARIVQSKSASLEELPPR